MHRRKSTRRTTIRWVAQERHLPQRSAICVIDEEDERKHLERKNHQKMMLIERKTQLSSSEIGIESWLGDRTNATWWLDGCALAHPSSGNNTIREVCQEPACSLAQLEATRRWAPSERQEHSIGT